MHKRAITIGMMAMVLFSCISKNKAPGNNNDVIVQKAEFDLIDTIPKITIRDTSLTFPQIFEGSFVKDTKAAQFGTEIMWSHCNSFHSYNGENWRNSTISYLN